MGQRGWACVDRLSFWPNMVESEPMTELAVDRMLHVGAFARVLMLQLYIVYLGLLLICLLAAFIDRPRLGIKAAAASVCVVFAVSIAVGPLGAPTLFPRLWKGVMWTITDTSMTSTEAIWARFLLHGLDGVEYLLFMILPIGFYRYFRSEG